MQPIVAKEGWFVVHLYYGLNRKQWQEQSQAVHLETRAGFQSIIEAFRKAPACQLNTYSVWGHKADFGVMAVDPDLNHLNDLENELLACFPAGSIQPVYSFVSMSEVSEYVAQERDYDRTLREKEGLSPDSGEYQKKMESYRARMQVFIDERIHPRLPEHRVMCFYPMNKARRDANNWYQLDFETRKGLMNGHMLTGRKFSGKVRQLVTGSFGLDAWEWGVTLFADDPFYLKRILYEMRFDPASAVYGEFGDFLVGIRLEADELFRRLRM